MITIVYKYIIILIIIFCYNLKINENCLTLIYYKYSFAHRFS